VLLDMCCIVFLTVLRRERDELIALLDMCCIVFLTVLGRERDELIALLDARERCVLDKLSSASRETCDRLQNESNNSKRNKSEEQVGEMAMIKVSSILLSVFNDNVTI